MNKKLLLTEWYSCRHSDHTECPRVHLALVCNPLRIHKFTRQLEASSLPCFPVSDELVDCELFSLSFSCTPPQSKTALSDEPAAPQFLYGRVSHRKPINLCTRFQGYPSPNLGDTTDLLLQLHHSWTLLGQWSKKKGRMSLWYFSATDANEGRTAKFLCMALRLILLFFIQFPYSGKPPP